MYLKKIKLFHKRHIDRCRSFYSSSIAGLFTGIIIGILFSLITDTSFNRWINLLHWGELFAAIVYFGFIFILIIILYFFGKICVYFFIAKPIKDSSKKKKCLVDFRINYFAGIYSASWTASLVLLYTKLMTAIYVSIIFILLYLPIEYFTVRNKKS